MEEIQYKYGLPYVTADTVLDIVQKLGIAPWQRTQEDTEFEQYHATDLTLVQQNELRFAPKTIVRHLKTPDGESYRGFLTTGKPWSTVFTLFPYRDVIIVAEYKHGADRIMIGLPSGVLDKSDTNADDPFLSCAKREVSEETGFTPTNIIRLAPGAFISGRNNDAECHPFFATVEDTTKGAASFDDTEHLVALLTPLSEWLKILETSSNMEMSNGFVTLLALRHLKLI